VATCTSDRPRQTLLALGDLAERKDIKVYFLSIGDVLDAPIKAKLMEEAWKTAISPEEEIIAAAYILDRLAKPGRLLAVNAGNHDLFSQKIAGYSHLDAAMSRLSREVPYARYEMVLKITLTHPAIKEPQTYTFELRHKFRGGGMHPSAAGARHLKNNYRDVDVVVAGHTHSSGTEKLALSGKVRHVVQLGSYKDPLRSCEEPRANAYDVENGYTHQNLDPDMGVILWPNRRRILVEETQAAIERLEDMAHRRSSNSTAKGSLGTSRFGASRSASAAARRAKSSGRKARRLGATCKTTPTATQRRSSRTSRIRSAKRGGRTSS
jgi:predicted phosphodiesterase